MRPNPWVALPVLLAGLAGGAIGWIVTGLTCLRGCPTAQVLVGIGSGILAMIGVGVVAVLAVMSLEEWRGRDEP